jgi:alkanesulfonate monooxygenase SsuD/methylene tetrahydromethanopterin reductase-like flavin-dependent oxidoreductase (luciferase family)
MEGAQMDVAIGLPNAVPGTTGEELTEWARRAEARGFSSLGTIDRLAYGNYEPLTALTAAAAVTERIGLWTSVLLGPLRANAAVLAKQTLSVHAVSGERLTLGIAVGGREDDYRLAGIDFESRGEALEAMLQRMRDLWDGDEIGPKTATPPRLILGGSIDAAFRRAARVGEGWVAGGAPPDQFAPMAEKVKEAWSEQGREGKPHIAGLAYFSLGDAAEENARNYLTDYYAWLGEEVSGYIAQSAAKDADTVQQYLQAFEAAGCEELIVFPTSGDPQQVDLLADAAGL